jgi:hypothetical protein
MIAGILLNIIVAVALNVERIFEILRSDGSECR